MIKTAVYYKYVKVVGANGFSFKRAGLDTSNVAKVSIAKGVAVGHPLAEFLFL